MTHKVIIQYLTEFKILPVNNDDEIETAISL